METLFGISLGYWTLIVLTLTLGILIRYAYDTFQNTRAQTYFRFITEMESEKNISQMSELNKLFFDSHQNLLALTSWPPRAVFLARAITNRFDVIAHMVERSFISKQLFLEIFSLSILKIWNNNAYFIQQIRSEHNNLNYQRRDLERLAMHCWLYQISIGFESNIKLISDDNQSIIDCSPSERNIVEYKIHSMKRENLLFLSLINR